jgi:hypothetical protein
LAIDTIRLLPPVPLHGLDFFVMAGLVAAMTFLPYLIKPHRNP